MSSIRIDEWIDTVYCVDCELCDTITAPTTIKAEAERIFLEHYNRHYNADGSLND